MSNFILNFKFLIRFSLKNINKKNVYKTLLFNWEVENKNVTSSGLDTLSVLNKSVGYHLLLIAFILHVKK